MSSLIRARRVSGQHLSRLQMDRLRCARCRGQVDGAATTRRGGSVRQAGPRLRNHKAHI